jgi:hypothetical protein
VNHIFVGGPDPRHIDSFGSNHVRRLSLRRDDEGFRRNWLDNDRRGNGGPPRGAGSSSSIEQGQLFIAAPSIRREASLALPSRVREFSNKPEVDRGRHMAWPMPRVPTSCARSSAMNWHARAPLSCRRKISGLSRAPHQRPPLVESLSRMSAKAVPKKVSPVPPRSSSPSHVR